MDTTKQFVCLRKVEYLHECKDSNLDIFVDKGYITAVMSNTSGAASPVARKISDLISRIKSPLDIE